MSTKDVFVLGTPPLLDVSKMMMDIDLSLLLMYVVTNFRIVLKMNIKTCKKSMVKKLKELKNDFYNLIATTNILQEIVKQSKPKTKNELFCLNVILSSLASQSIMLFSRIIDDTNDSSLRSIFEKFNDDFERLAIKICQAPMYVMENLYSLDSETIEKFEELNKKHQIAGTNIKRTQYKEKINKAKEIYENISKDPRMNKIHDTRDKVLSHNDLNAPNELKTYNEQIEYICESIEKLKNIFEHLSFIIEDSDIVFTGIDEQSKDASRKFCQRLA